MKAYSKSFLLVVLALILILTACTRQANTKSVNPTPTSQGEAPFPYTTPGAGGGVLDFGTQTAIAKTPQVVIATNTPSAGEAAAATAPAEQPASGGGAEAGGGVAPTQAPAAAAVNTPVVERPGTYTIQKGEFPFCIARRYNLDLPTFLAQNGLSVTSNNIPAGRSLTIPSGGTWNPAYGSRTLKAHPTSYTVTAGETVYSIACKFGDVTPEAILAVNGLGGANDVKAGQTLQIP